MAAALDKLFEGSPDVSEHPIFKHGILASIGNTPLLDIPSLSLATGCRIFGKAEFLNPGGSVKDRAALRIIAEAEAQGKLIPARDSKSGEPFTVVEGTGGNTGIGLALVAAARGYKCHVFAPENCSQEKVAAAKLLGAGVTICPIVPFSSEEHYYHHAVRHAASTPNSYWGNQFEGLANARAHAATTGPEILQQAGGRVDAIVMSAGTGGSIAGISIFLRSKLPNIRVYLLDPPGSSLASHVRCGVLAASEGSTIAEGVGIARLTANFLSAHVDEVLSCSDAEVTAMAHYLRARDGLCIGPSAAMNVCGAVKVARLLGPGHTVVTLLCDGGERYASKLFSAPWLQEKGLVEHAAPDATRDHADFVL
jgi:cysteine synthase A